MDCWESEFGFPCRRHWSLRGNPGVCPACLAERLSQLLASHFSCTSTCYYRRAGVNSYSYSLSSSPPRSSPSSHSSTAFSPAGRGHHRVASDVLGSFSVVVNGSGGEFCKSRSMAYAGECRAGDVGRGKKKMGFWRKLLLSTGKRTRGVFGHSLTVVERFEHRT
ncbi:hypothetical protein NMG60_11007324 [Bertholletia excelsa]